MIPLTSKVIIPSDIQIEITWNFGGLIYQVTQVNILQLIMISSNYSDIHNKDKISFPRLFHKKLYKDIFDGTISCQCIYYKFLSPPSHAHKLIQIQNITSESIKQYRNGIIYGPTKSIINSFATNIIPKINFMDEAIENIKYNTDKVWEIMGCGTINLNIILDVLNLDRSCKNSQYKHLTLQQQKKINIGRILIECLKRGNQYSWHLIPLTETEEDNNLLMNIKQYMKENKLKNIIFSSVTMQTVEYIKKLFHYKSVWVLNLHHIRNII